MDRMALRVGMLCAALTVVACGGDTPGPITLPDASGTDAGGGGTDAGGGGTDAGDGCPALEAMLPAGGVCASSTLTCLMGAMTQAEQQACFDADPMPMPCLACVNQEIIASCTMDGGCDDENGEVQCCVEEACAATPTEACAAMATGMGGACAAEVNTLIMCVNAAAMARSCGVSMLCFGAATTFAPDFRAPEINYSIDPSSFRLYSFFDAR